MRAGSSGPQQGLLLRRIYGLGCSIADPLLGRSESSGFSTWDLAFRQAARFGCCVVVRRASNHRPLMSTTRLGIEVSARFSDALRQCEDGAKSRQFWLQKRH